MSTSLNKSLIALLILLNPLVGMTQWNQWEETNYEGDFIRTFTLETNARAMLVFQVEKRSNTAYIYLNSFLDYWHLESDDELSIDEFAISFRFNDDPRVFYSANNMLQIGSERALLFLSDKIQINSTSYDSGVTAIGVTQDNPDVENPKLLWEAHGFISPYYDLINLLKKKTTLYAAFRTKGKSTLMEFDLNGSSKAIDAIYNPSKKTTGLLLGGFVPKKTFYNENSKFFQSSLTD